MSPNCSAIFTSAAWRPRAFSRVLCSGFVCDRIYSCLAPRCCSEAMSGTPPPRSRSAATLESPRMSNMSKSDLQADYNDMEPDGVDDRLRGNGRPGQWLEKGKEFLLSNVQEELRRSIDIPLPTTTPRAFEVRKVAVSAATIVPIWIALSSAVIIYNKYLYSNLSFPYPVFITSFHLGCAALGTRVLRATTNLMDGLDNIVMTRELYLKSILPIGVLFSGSLILSNVAYLTLSVSFIQMLKAFTPVAILLISAIFKIQTMNQKLVIIVLLISCGCALAAYGELKFEMFGFLCQSSAVLFEASRLVMIQILLQNLKMDPLCSLHYYAPVCATINGLIIPFTEGWAPFRELARIGPLILSTNAGIAFGLNVAAVYLVGATSGLVLTLAGVFKDILLISSSCLFFGSVITPIQVFGYSLALTGLVMYKTASKGGK